jgi:hypothetical protein
MIPAMRSHLLLALALGCAACGGAGAPANSPPPPPAEVSPPPSAEETPPAPAVAPPSEPAEPAASLAPEPAPAPASSGAPKIEFPPHASVAAARDAVPQGLPRRNMSDDVMQAPLLDLKHYDKCKVPRSIKVSMNVAVYDGAAVGVDVTTKPKNAKIEACLDGVVRSLTWDKVPSLNEVNVNF